MMRRILLLSVALNLVLAGALYRAHQRIRALDAKPLPKKKPDFAAVEAELRSILTEPQFAQLVTLKSFDAGVWLCQATVLHSTPWVESNWHLLEEIVARVIKRCGIPGRVSGSHFDGSSPPRFIGDLLEFGYSPEVGYAHPNEFSERTAVQ